MLAMQISSSKTTELADLIQDINPEMTAEQATAMAQIYKCVGRGDYLSPVDRNKKHR